MPSSSQSTKNIRRDFERSWPKDILASRVSMTPLLALEKNAKRVLDETKRIGKEEEEEEVYEDISADAKEIETLLDEMRKERDVCVCFHHNHHHRSVSHDDEDEKKKKKKKKKKEEKFLRSCFPRQGVKVVRRKRSFFGRAGAHLRSIFVRKGRGRRKMDDGCDRVHREIEKIERVHRRRKLRDGRESERASIGSVLGRDGVF